MERHRGWHQRPVAGACRLGQGAVEYALVVAGVLVVALGFAAILHAVSQGGAAQGVADALTHRLPKGVLDVALF